MAGARRAVRRGGLPGGAHRALPAAALALILCAAPATATLGPARPDTARWRFEVGASSDYTNEIYYLDSLATPTLVERQRFDIPEARHAGVLLATLEGTRARRATSYALAHELSVGDLLRRSSLFGRWKQSLGPDWRLLVAPRAQYRRDRTLGRDFEEYQAAATARLRRILGGPVSSAEFGVLGDWLRTAGTGAGLLPDRWSAGTTASLEESNFEGVDWRLEYIFRGRGFPDSSARDHLEHETRGRARTGWGIASFAAVEATVVRRATVRLAPTSQDNFWEESAALDLVHNSAGPVGWPARVEFEAAQFDVEDDLLYFPHQAVRARAGARLQPGGNWTLECGPIAERLLARRAPAEEYAEFGGFAEFESITSGSLWSVTPAAGRRDYRSPSGSTATDVYALGRTSFGFVQVDLLGDQRLPAGWRARISGNARWEFHEDSAENAGSLYFSLDVRRLF